MKIESFSPSAILNIAWIHAHLRPMDKAWLAAVGEKSEPIEFAQNIAYQHIGHVISKDDMPIAYWGAHTLWPGVWRFALMATDKWPDVALEASINLKRYLPKTMEKAGIHRAECYTLASCHDEHRWLEWLGAEREAEIKAFGVNGEDFIIYRWLKEKENVCGAAET